jgi:hypothetical protein
MWQTIKIKRFKMLSSRKIITKSQSMVRRTEVKIARSNIKIDTITEIDIKTIIDISKNKQDIGYFSTVRQW